MASEGLTPLHLAAGKHAPLSSYALRRPDRARGGTANGHSWCCKALLVAKVLFSPASAVPPLCIRCATSCPHLEEFSSLFK